MLELDMEKEDVEHDLAHAELAEKPGYVDLYMKLEEMAVAPCGRMPARRETE